MMLLADHLSLNRFYILKDSIFQFNEFFKSEYGFKEYFSDCDTMARALAFMSIIMEALGRLLLFYFTEILLF